LYDLVSYDKKRNWANGHNNTDGTNDRSWNCGWEGDEDVPQAIVDLRKKQVKKAVSLLFLSNGTPMFRMGDEFLQTQHGNGNPYNQDNSTTWLDWDRCQSNADIFRFFKLWIAFRKKHPSLSRSVFWHTDVQWYGVEHDCDFSPESRAFSYCLRGASEDDIDLYVMLNTDSNPKTFQIQEGTPGSWTRFVDTARATPGDICECSGKEVVDSVHYTVQERSVVVLTKG
jgi:glycogen operon protein